MRWLVSIVFAFVISCTSVGYRSFNDAHFSKIGDIPPLSGTILKVALPGNSNLKESAYYRTFLRGVERMRSGEYSRAIQHFSKCIKEYDDEGNSFFLRAICHFSLQQYARSIADFARAGQSGYEEDKTGFRIATTYNKMIARAYANKKWVRVIGYCKASLAYFTETTAVKNALYAYANLARIRTGAAAVVTALYGYNFMKNHRVKASPEYHGLAFALGNAVMRLDNRKLIREAIPRLLYSAGYRGRHKDKAYLHKMLAFLYTKLGQEEKAREQFAIIINRYPGSEFYKESKKQFFALGKPVFNYHSKYLFRVSSGSADIDDYTIDFVLSLPQDVDAQKSSSPKVLINGKPISYSVKRDQNGSRFALLDLKGKVRKGVNLLEVKAVVEKKGIRIPVKRVRGKTLKDYNRKSARYKVLTSSTKIVRVKSPVVRSMLKELRGKIRTDNIHEIVKVVYNYVIDRLTYKLYGENRRPKERIIPRLGRRSTGVCEDYAALTVALLRGFGIPASCYTGPVLNEKIGHAWPVFYLPDFTAVTVDTTWGDTPGFRDYYLYYASSLTVASQTLYDSNVLPGAGNLSLSSDGRMRVKILSTSTRLIKRK